MPLGPISQLSRTLAHAYPTLIWSQILPWEQKDNPFLKPKDGAAQLVEGPQLVGWVVCLRVKGLLTGSSAIFPEPWKDKGSVDASV